MKLIAHLETWMRGPAEAKDSSFNSAANDWPMLTRDARNTAVLRRDIGQLAAPAGNVFPMQIDLRLSALQVDGTVLDSWKLQGAEGQQPRAMENVALYLRNSQVIDRDQRWPVSAFGRGFG